MDGAVGATVTLTTETATAEQCHILGKQGPRQLLFYTAGRRVPPGTCRVVVVTTVLCRKEFCPSGVVCRCLAESRGYVVI